MAYALGVRAPGGGYTEVTGGDYARAGEDGRFPAATATWGVIRAYRQDDGEWVPLTMVRLVHVGERVMLDTAAGLLRPAGDDVPASGVALTAKRAPTLRG